MFAPLYHYYIAFKVICLQGVGFFDCIAVFCVAEGVTLFAGGGGPGFGGFWAVAPQESFEK